MRVIIYDKNPGEGFGQWFLKTCWFIGAFFQQLFGKVDAYYGATSWDNALQWLLLHPVKLKSIQYWGHGSPGCVWLAGQNAQLSQLLKLKDSLSPDSLVWFRTCSTFQGPRGIDFAESLSKLLKCRVAGHTRIIGVFQGGLHSLGAGETPSWSVAEGEFPKSLLAQNGLKWGSNTIWCFQTKIPAGW